MAFKPNWVSHPGVHLALCLEELGLSQAEFALKAGMTAKLVNTIIKGKNPITAETAVKLEIILGLKAEVWLAFQAKWDINRVRLEKIPAYA